MRLIHAAAAALNQTPLDWPGNKANVLGAIARAREQGVGLLCLPELCITGYGCEDAFQSPGVQEMAWRVLREIEPETRGMAACVGLPVMANNALYNAAALLVDGRLVGLACKQFLAGDGIHYEPRWFRPWPAGQRTLLERDGEAYPLGDLFFDVGGVRIGFEICEDAWVAHRPGGQLSQYGVDAILNPSASHFAFGKTDVRRRFVLEGSRAFGVSYIYGNLLGNEAGRAIYDGDAMIASGGKMLATGERFSFARFSLTTATIDVDLTRMNRARMASFEPRFDAPAGEEVDCPFDWPKVEPAQADATTPDWERGEHVKEEEFSRAVRLGLFDYMRKSRSRGFVVSLSGGADSAACACLVGMMAEAGVQELGLDSFRQRLGYIDSLADAKDAADVTRALLTCVYQRTRNSSETTFNAAKDVAAAVGGRFLHFDVDALVQGYTDLVSEALGRRLTWETDDIALQNIQARVRAPGVWMLANVEGALLLATSNRSEAAVGYTTMDGDTCGGLSPIAGIDKAFLRRWLLWLERHGPADGRPIPKLAAVNRQQPTAELRPSEAEQTDEGDLMPYELLDAIERAAIRDKHAPLDVFRLLRPSFSQHSTDQLCRWIERFFTLWSRNQWKRERYSPSFHVDDENLDPKTWCRFPILSGGFARELAELREHCAKLPD